MEVKHGRLTRGKWKFGKGKFNIIWRKEYGRAVGKKNKSGTEKDILITVNNNRDKDTKVEVAGTCGKNSQ